MGADEAESIASILMQYDERQDPIEIIDLCGALNSLVVRCREAGRQIPEDWLAEQIAFQVIPDYSNRDSGWGTYYGPVMEFKNGVTIPDFKAITVGHIEHWVSRSRAAKHPQLRARYADVAWDFSRKISPKSCPHDVPRILVEAVLDSVTRSLFQDEVWGIQDLRRVLSICIHLKDHKLICRVRDTILAFENQIAVDDLPGLWGFSFDLLLEDSKKVHLEAHQERKILSDLESRLARLVGHQELSKLDPHHVEGAALRLARYYRRKNMPDDMRRVLLQYADAFIRKTGEKPSLVGAGWLKQVHDRLISFNLHEDAKAILPLYSEAAQKMKDQMPRHEVSTSIGREEFEQYLCEMTSGVWEEVFGKIVAHYLLRRDCEMASLRELLKDRVILNLFPPTLVDHTGRDVARIGTLAEDPEGNLVHQFSQKMGFAYAFLRNVIDRLVTMRSLSVQEITIFVYQSPILDPHKRTIVEEALRAYLAGHWLVAIHLMIPQIEDAIRRLVGMSGGAVMKKGKNDGMMLRTVDDLLRDECLLPVLGEDVMFYLRVLLTDQRGWNVRNDVAHGITPASGFNAQVADRLFHTLLLLGSFRSLEGKDSSAVIPSDSIRAESTKSSDRE